MKQISNWVFGSFFRTIGRLLVFVLLGIIISNLIDFGDLIDNFSIKNLFFTKIKADSYYSGWWETLYTDSAKTTQYPYTSGYAYKNITSTNGVNISLFDYYLSATLSKNQNYDHVYIPFLLMGQTYSNVSSSVTTDDILTCRRFYCSSYDIDGSCAKWRCDEWYTASNGETNTINNPTNVNFTFNVYLQDDNGDNTMCVIHNNYADCALQANKTYTHIRVMYNYNNANTNQSLRFGISRMLQLYNSDGNAISNSINNQNQQQHSDHQETQSYLEDSNTTQAENSASSFFSSFSVNLGGLTGIITAPLNTIQSLLNSTCTNLVLPLPFVNKNLTLPCMNDIYSQHFGLFFTLYQTIILGIIAYRCIMSIFFDIKGFTNPDDDRIEVMDL